MTTANGMQDAVESATTPPSDVLTRLTALQQSRTTPSQPPSAEPEFIPVEEVARKLGGVCNRTIRRLSDKGELCQPVKVGGRSMYPKQEVLDFMYRKMRARRA